MELVANAMMAFHDSSALTDNTHVFWMSFMLGSFINHEETSNVKEKLIGPHRIWKSDCRVLLLKMNGYILCKYVTHCNLITLVTRWLYSKSKSKSKKTLFQVGKIKQ